MATLPTFATMHWPPRRGGLLAAGTGAPVCPLPQLLSAPGRREYRCCSPASGSAALMRDPLHTPSPMPVLPLKPRVSPHRPRSAASCFTSSPSLPPAVSEFCLITILNTKPAKTTLSRALHASQLLHTPDTLGPCQGNSSWALSHTPGRLRTRKTLMRYPH